MENPRLEDVSCASHQGSSIVTTEGAESSGRAALIARVLIDRTSREGYLEADLPWAHTRCNLTRRYP